MTVKVRAFLAAVGADVSIGYGLFIVIAIFVSLISAAGPYQIKIMLTDLLSGDMASAALGGVNGKGLLLVLLATATIAVPYFWRRRLAPLAFVVPLLFTFVGFWPLYKQHRAQQEAMDALGEFGPAMGQLGQQMGAGSGPFDSFGIGAWLLFATVIFLAIKGVMRCLARGQAAATSSSAS